MKRKIVLLTAIILSLSLLLTSCAKKDNTFVNVIGEEKAKEAGLALINKVFDVNETEATVEYKEWAGVTYVNGCYAQYGTEEPNRVYVIKVDPDEIGNGRFYAEVNAVTGIAYRAERDSSKIVLTEKQLKQTNMLETLDEFYPDDFLDIQKEGMSVVFSLLKDRLERDVPMFGIYPDLIESDSVDFPKVRLGYIILMEDDTIYDLTLLWPSMDLIGVYIRNLD